MYSAIKVGGKRLYNLARRGIEIERAPREIEIFSLDLIDLKNNIATIKVLCSKGTYIRSLCNDVGQTLGFGAAMGELTRTRSGKFLIEDSVPLERVGEAEIIPIEKALGFNKITLPSKFDKQLFNGARITFENNFDGENVLLFSSGGRLGGIYASTSGVLIPRKIFQIPG
jgi:tRNA pseudouridine55 synthase